jgi:hypothetical protein
MRNLPLAPIAVPPGRELAMSALADARRRRMRSPRRRI